KIYLDANQDGVLDISDTLVKDGLELQSNQTVHLWVVADTSLQTPDQSKSELPLTAQIREEPDQQKTVQDPVQVFEAKLKIEKVVDQQLLTINHQAQTLNYTLTVTNSASLPVLPATVTVDGQKQSWLIIEDPLPANTVFEEIQVSDPVSNILVLH